MLLPASIKLAKGSTVDTALMTGIEVVMVISPAENNKTKAPTNIQNSLETALSSLGGVGISLLLYL